MSLIVKNLSISNQKLQIFEKFNITVGKGEICSVMGPSGSGKSTLLSFICGTIHNQGFTFSGRLYLNHVEITQKPIDLRKVGILFQDDLLFPHMTIEQNLSFAIPSRVGKAERKKEVEKMLKIVHLQGYEHRYPRTLSGGQRARISLLRTLLAEPQVLLLDEPFSKLDIPLRKEFREFTFGFVKELNIPTILVTHDINDIPPDSRRVELSEPKSLFPDDYEQENLPDADQKNDHERDDENDDQTRGSN